jgi:phenylacetate-CoA ligase
MSTQMSLQQQFYEMLMESQWWSAEQLRDYQRSQLSQLLRHAKKNVPFYEHRLDAVLKPNGDIDWDRWSEIPIVKRQDMIDHRDAMQAKELPPGHGPTAVFETSGTTGAAISVTTTSLMSLASNGLRWRCHVWNDLDWTKTLCIRDGSDPERGKPPRGTPVGPWGPTWDVIAQTGRSWLITKLASGEETLDFLRDRNCAYLNTGPKTVHTYALDAIRLDRNVQLEAVLCQGSNIDEADHEIARQVFGARLIEHYSSREAGQMAHVCGLGHLHINSECVFVEIVGDDGRPAPAGTVGRTVVTPFFNTAQPLIRYDQGDMAIAGGRCECGRMLPTLGAIVGREVAMFRHPDGRVVAQLLPPRATSDLGCTFYQVAQVGPRLYEVRYVPAAIDAVADETAFTEVFRATFFSDAELRFRRVAEIAVGPSGKMQQYVVETGARLD